MPHACGFFSLAAKGAVTTENHHTVSFSESDYTFSYDENGNIVIGAVDGDVSYSSPDEPGLPQRSFSIAIPGTRKYALLKYQLFQETDPEQCQNRNGPHSSADRRQRRKHTDKGSDV